MPARRTRGNPLSLKATNPTKQRVGKPDMRDYKNINPGKRPSAEYDWEPALLAFALTMWSLGYPLSKEQKQRIEDYGNS
jgi:hypothetical protein